jgi:hypothetical protein
LLSAPLTPLTKLTVSPPPIIERAPLAVDLITSSKTAVEPDLNLGTSNNP